MHTIVSDMQNLAVVKKPHMGALLTGHQGYARADWLGQSLKVAHVAPLQAVPLTDCRHHPRHASRQILTRNHLPCVNQQVHTVVVLPVIHLVEKRVNHRKPRSIGKRSMVYTTPVLTVFSRSACAVNVHSPELSRVMLATSSVLMVSSGAVSWSWR